MDALNTYREAIRNVLEPYTRIEYANVRIRNELICDEKNDRYLIMSEGWADNPRRRIHGCLIHVDIIDGKVWIQRDGTEDGVAGELEEAGIPKHDMVLGFHDPRVRKYTGYAAA